MSLIDTLFITIAIRRKLNYLVQQIGLWNILKNNIQFVSSLGLENSIDTPDNVFDGVNMRDQLNTTGKVLQERIHKMFVILANMGDLYNNTVINLINSGFLQEDAIKKGNEMIKQNFMKIIKDRNLDKPTRQEIYFIKSLQLDPSQEKREIANLNYKFN